MTANFYDNFKDKIFEIILQEVREKENILDIGCGNCELVFFLAKKLKHINVVGIDLYNKEFSNIIEKDRRKKVLNQVQCIEGDAANLHSLQKRSFDAVISKYSLHEFQNPSAVLKEAFTTLNKEGKIIIVDFVRETLADRLWGEKYYSPEGIEKIVKRVGFQEIKFQLLSPEGPVILTGIKL